MFELTPYERRHQRALFNPFRDMENFEKNFWGDMAATDFKTESCPDSRRKTFMSTLKTAT